MGFDFPDVFAGLQLGDHLMFRIHADGPVFRGTISEIDKEDRSLLATHLTGNREEDTKNGWQADLAYVPFGNIEASWPATKAVNIRPSDAFMLHRLPSEWTERHDGISD